MTSDQILMADLEYEGWAPCIHDESDRAKFAAWFAPIAADLNISTDPWGGGALESLLWLLNDLGACPMLACDQWTACICEGQIAGKKVKTRIQGDTFLLSVAESYRWWRDKTAESFH